jgi:adenine/guanine phosphoribosyltransferase-like PRPP-binding protein
VALLERVEERRMVDADPASEWIARDVAFCNELDDRLLFDSFVDGIAAIARDLHVEAVGGVSTAGRRLAHAVSQTIGVASWTGERGPRSVLLVDGLVNTGIQLLLGVRAAHEAGVEVVAGAAVRAQRAAIARLRESGAEVRALQLV